MPPSNAQPTATPRVTHATHAKAPRLHPGKLTTMMRSVHWGLTLGKVGAAGTTRQSNPATPLPLPQDFSITPKTSILCPQTQRPC
jgi:hypothetical protein